MFLLVLFAFLAGVVTVLSPCILPILPIVLSGGMAGGKRRPLGIVTGFIASFTFFTLALGAIVNLTGISADALRTTSIIIIFLFGLFLLIPAAQLVLEKLFSKFSALAPRSNASTGFFGGIMVGLSIGLLWTPCVGPILASVITLAATSTVTFGTVVITLAYSAGTGIPMLLIIYGGRGLLQKVPWLLANTGKIQKIFGAIMLLTAIGIYFNVDRTFQTYIITKFPNYGVGLNKFQENATVKKELEQLKPTQQPQQQPKAQAVPPRASLQKKYPQAPELIPGGKWFNSPPLTLAGLRGKVVLVDFWTYTCINCIRTLPYLELWHEKYADKGLVIIGVHTPEFKFEENPENVKKAIADFGLKYPVMQDNDYATWNAYSNRYWPAKYFIDAQGQIRGTHFGEGEYDQSEKLIQQLLGEAGANIANMPVNNPTYSIDAQTPESYLGYGRIDNFASPEAIVQDKEARYTAPRALAQNYFAYDGLWTISQERAMPQARAALTLNFNARNVFLVMRPKNGLFARAKIYLDGAIITQENSGDDVENGEVMVVDDGLYTLVKLQAPGQHLLKLEFEDPNAELYAFTFG